MGTRFRFRPSIVGALAALTVGFDASPRTGGDGRPGLQGPPAAGAVATAVVRVDVIVTDRQGAPVLNLSHGDFEVSDDGVRQALDSVELRRAGRQVGPSPAALPPVQSALDERTEARREGARLFALFLDEYHVSAGANAARVREALARLVDDELRPWDLAVAMRPLDPLASIRLTRDRDALRDAAAAFAGRRGDYVPRTPFEQSVMSREPGAVEPVRDQVVLSALNALAAHLGGLAEGRKALVLVSEGFGSEPARADTRLPDAQTVIRMANRANVSIYALDPRAEEDPEPAGGGRRTNPVLSALAGETGGEVIAAAGDPDFGLRRIARDLDAYYLLTYRSARANDGKLHALRVQVKDRTLQVRTRSGYWALAPVGAPPGSPGPAEKPQRQRLLHQSTLIRPWLGMARGSDGRTRVTFTWEPASRLAGARQRAEARGVVLNATAADGTPLFTGRIASVYADPAGADTPARRAVFDAPPGRVELDLTIQGDDERVIDTDARDVEVADLAGLRLAMGTPAVLRTRTAREFLAAGADPDAPPVASREFSRSERLLIRVPVYGPAAAAVTARLLNRLGQPLRELQAMAALTRDGAVQFDLPLASFAVGEYTLELTAASAADRVAELLFFRVTS